MTDEIVVGLDSTARDSTLMSGSRGGGGREKRRRPSLLASGGKTANHSLAWPRCGPNALTPPHLPSSYSCFLHGWQTNHRKTCRPRPLCHHPVTLSTLEPQRAAEVNWRRRGAFECHSACRRRGSLVSSSVPENCLDAPSCLCDSEFPYMVCLFICCFLFKILLM